MVNWIKYLSANHNSRVIEWRRGGKALVASWAALLLLGAAGCSTSHYHRAADKEAYGIVQQFEGKIFGRTNEFTIDTRYSARKPAEILPAELIADRQQTNRRTLTLEGALELAAKESRRYQTEKERLYLTALTLTGARYQFGPKFFAGATASFGNENQRVDPAGSVNSQIGVGQFLKSGGELGAKLANDLFRYYTGDPQRSVVSVLSVNLAQPLLRGFGRNNPSVEALTQAERNMVYAVRSYSYFQNEFAVEIVNDYVALLARRDNIRNTYTNFLGRVQSRKRLEARKDREQLSGVDQARQSELSTRNTYVNALANYRNALDQFKIKLGLPLSEQIYLDDSVLDVLQEKGLIPAPLDPDKAFRFAVDNQLTTLNAIDEFEDAKRKVRVMADRLRPDLNLFARASLDSDRPTDYTKFDLDDIRYTAGLELDLPFDRLQQRNDYRSAVVSFEAKLRDLTLTLDNLKDSIERGLRTLEQRRQNYEIQKKALALANRRVASTTLLQQAGRADVRDIVEAQDAQITAQNSFTDALVLYQQTRLQLLLDVGMIETGSAQFWLKDHLANFQSIASAVPPVAAEDTPVIPPETFFNN